MYACIHLPDPPSSGPDAGALAGGFSPHVEMIDARTAVLSITDRQLRELTINLTGWQGVALTHDLQSSWQGIAQPNGASIAVAACDGDDAVSLRAIGNHRRVAHQRDISSISLDGGRTRTDVAAVLSFGCR